jgi:biopolymer transport protein ExbD
MSMSGGSDDGSPMMEMNTTPLIDVMLVLLIMFIISIPVATHSVDIDLPPPNPPDMPPPPVDPVKNKLAISWDNKILWNTIPITSSQLVANLQASTQMPVEPELQFQPEPMASYELSARVLRIIKATGVTKFGFVGNEQYSEFDRAPNSASPTK